MKVDSCYRNTATMSGGLYSSLEMAKLILNCVEFLVRGYSRRSEIPRILATYEWSEVESRLFAQQTPDNEKISKWKTPTGTEKWIVYPHSDMVKDDDVLLAHIANDETYAANAAKSIFSQLDPTRFRNGEELPITAAPWFNSETKLKCRGFWSEDKRTSIALSLLVLKSQPASPSKLVAITPHAPQLLRIALSRSALSLCVMIQ